MVERRQADRSKTTRGALMFFSRRPGVFTCTLRDITEFGIGLSLHDPDIIAPTLHLTLDNFNSVQLFQVIWARGRYVGAILRQAIERESIPNQAYPATVERF
jgi:hypothetical protein